jgi:hypothetical protein
MDWLSKIFEFLKLPVKIIAFIALISGILLLIPEQLIETLKLTDFIKEFGQYFGIAFLISSTYLMFIFFPFVFNNIMNRYKNAKTKRNFINRIEETLQNLTYPEKCLLREFIIQSKHVIEAPNENTEVISLLSKGVIQYASANVRSFIFGNYVSIKINDDAKKYFTNETYGLPNREPTKEDREKVKRERPDYLTNLNYINQLMNFGRRW